MSERRRRPTPKCRACGGTGKLLLFNSAFTADGVRRVRCWICDGTGKSRFHPEPGFAKQQANLREREGR